MHIKYSNYRNLDGVRFATRATSPVPGPLPLSLSGAGDSDFGRDDVGSGGDCESAANKKTGTRLTLAEGSPPLANKDNNNNEDLVNRSGTGGNLQSHKITPKDDNNMSRRHSPLATLNRQPILIGSSHNSSSTVSPTSNRITSKGALSTLIGLFRFRNEAVYTPSPKSAKAHHRHSGRRRLSLERINTRENVDSQCRTASSLHSTYPSRGMNRRANSLQSLNEVLNSFAELSAPPTRLGPRDENEPKRVSSWTCETPKRHLVKFVNDEPMLISTVVRSTGLKSAGEVVPPKSILRVRNPSDSTTFSEIVSFRASSSSSPSSSASSSVSSSKKVHFAQPLLTTYAICDGS